MTEKGGGEEVEKGVEAELVVQALRLNTLSKLTFADSSRYTHLFLSCIYKIYLEYFTRPCNCSRLRSDHLVGTLGSIWSDFLCNSLCCHNSFQNSGLLTL